MNSTSTKFKLGNQKIWEFFDFISAPYKLKTLFELSETREVDEKPEIKSLLDLTNQQNLTCFQLCVESKKAKIDLYYIDIETPIVFYFTPSKIIGRESIRVFSTVSKGIRHNLATYYNQESEINILHYNPKQNSKDSQFVVYKMEDQNFKLKMEQIELKNGRRKSPFGKFNPKNKLSLLTGREWIRFTKSWLILRPPRRSENEILHPAKFPEILIRKFICFFTKPGEIVLDPFLGSGSALIAAKQCNRSGIGVEIADKYVKISHERLQSMYIPSYPPIYTTKQVSFWKIVKGDSLHLIKLWEENNFPIVDFVITSPPYWSQLDRNEMRQQERKKKGLDTQYSSADPRDFGNIGDYQEFLKRQKQVFDQILQLIKPKGYLVIITNNVFTRGKLYPLAYDTATILSNGKWTLKDEKIWLQDDKRLLALGVNNAWVGNRCHQFCLIFRKED
ncbi:MAG: DNA methyltransferase [Candidatus Hodarchaeales archaeon]|jgi:DNA modification methylase